MEEILQLIVRGCEKSRHLEENLPEVASNIDILSATCKAIATDFGNAVDRLSSVQVLNGGSMCYMALSERAALLSEVGIAIRPSGEAQSCAGNDRLLSPPMATPAAVAVSSPQRPTRKRWSFSKLCRSCGVTWITLSYV